MNHSVMHVAQRSPPVPGSETVSEHQAASRLSVVFASTDSISLSFGDWDVVDINRR